MRFDEHAEAVETQGLLENKAAIAAVQWFYDLL